MISGLAFGEQYSGVAPGIAPSLSAMLPDLPLTPAVTAESSVPQITADLPAAPSTTTSGQVAPPPPP